jgi:hypothetical protein
MNPHQESYSTAKELVDQHGLEDAAAYAVHQIARLYEQKDFYELSIWREIRKAIAEMAAATTEERKE